MICKLATVALLLCAATICVFAQSQPGLSTSLWTTTVINATSSTVYSTNPVSFNGSTFIATTLSSSSNTNYWYNKLSCVNDANGQVQWTMTVFNSVNSLLVQNGQVIVTTQAWIAAVSPAGQVAWNLSAVDMTPTFYLENTAPVISTDGTTLFTYGWTPGNTDLFSVFAVDLTAASPKLTSVFNDSTHGSFYNSQALNSAYLIPAYGVDFLFLYSTGATYYNLNTSNFTDSRYSSIGSVSTPIGPPVVDQVAGVIYTAYSYIIQGRNFTTGASVFSATQVTGLGSNFQVYALCGVFASNGTMIALNGWGAYSYQETWGVFQMLPYDPTSTSQYLTQVATRSSSSGTGNLIGCDWTAAGCATVYFSISDTNMEGNFGAFSLSTFTSLWNTSSFLYQSTSSSSSYSPTVRATSYLNGKIIATVSGYQNGGTSNPLGSRTTYLLVLNATTGMYTSQFVFSSYNTVNWISNDIFTAAGDTVLLFYSTGTLTSYVATAVGISTSLSNTICTTVTYANDALYFGTGNNYLTIVGATNGTVLYSQPLDSSASASLAPLYAPAVVNGRVFMFGAYSSWNVYVADPFGTTPTSVITSSTWGAACSYPGSVGVYSGFTVSPDGMYVYFSAGGGECVIQIATTPGAQGTYAVSASNTKDNVYQTPLAVGSYVYVADSDGHLQWVRASTFSSTSTVNLVTATTTAGTYPGDIAYYGGQLYFACTDALYKYSDTALIQQWKVTSGLSVSNSYGSRSTNAPPVWFYRGNVLTFNQSLGGTGVVSFNAYGGWLGDSTALSWTLTLATSNKLALPAITPDGLFVFANTDGVFAIGSNGTFLWSRTDLSCADYNTATNAQTPVVSMGVVYVVCSKAMTLLDLYRNGSTWQAGSAASSQTTAPYATSSSGSGAAFFVNPNTSQIVVINGNQVSITNVTGQLYAASQLPAPLPPYEGSLEDTLKENKLWIAGAVLGVIVVIVIVVVAKKMSSGGANRKDTDYVTMQNMEKPVNAV